MFFTYQNVTLKVSKGSFFHVRHFTSWIKGHNVILKEAFFLVIVRKGSLLVPLN